MTCHSQTLETNMSKLLVLTFADKPLAEKNYLKQSCKELGINLKVLISSPWIQNVIKLKMLFEFVKQQDPELILLVVDAYDVVLYASETEVLKKYEELEAEIVFSGESNFMYKEPAKWFEFLRKYPRQASIYQYLNSGSYMGKAKHILTMLDEMQKWFGIELQNEEKLLPIKSDQYLLSRFYVENFHQNGSLKISIDSDHSLLGCTGGRFCVIKFPDISKWQSFASFILERNLLKLFKLHKHQKLPKDYYPVGSGFSNHKTNTSPPVMHFPGTWDRFDKVYEDLLMSKKPSKGGSWIFAALISSISFITSLVAGPLFWLVTRK